MYFAIKQILSRISKKNLLILELSRLKSFVAGIPTLLLQIFLLHIMLCIHTYHLSYICSMILINEHDRIRNFDRICHRHIKTFTSLAP